MNPIEKCWSYVKQALHRRERQPTIEAEMRQAEKEEWEAIPQAWINLLILKQEHWVWRGPVRDVSRKNFTGFTHLTKATSTIKKSIINRIY
jgi:hypothetical protein